MNGKSRLPELWRDVERGQTLLITRQGRQIARIERGSVFSAPVRYPTSKRFPVPAVETDMRDGFETDKAILVLKKAMEATLDDGRWQEFVFARQGRGCRNIPNFRLDPTKLCRPQAGRCNTSVAD